jgi:hypothetical protein
VEELALGGRTGPSELEKLADNTEYSSQIKEVEATLKHQREILRGKQSAKNYIYRMLESEKEDLLVDEFHERIRLLNDEITQILLRAFN